MSCYNRRRCNETIEPGAATPSCFVEEIGDEFRRELLAQVTHHIGPNHFGSERRESSEQKAARSISEELAKLGLSGSLLRQRPCR